MNCLRFEGRGSFLMVTTRSDIWASYCSGQSHPHLHLGQSVILFKTIMVKLIHIYCFIVCISSITWEMTCLLFHFYDISVWYHFGIFPNIVGKLQIVHIPLLFYTLVEVGHIAFQRNIWHQQTGTVGYEMLQLFDDIIMVYLAALTQFTSVINGPNCIVGKVCR